MPRISIVVPVYNMDNAQEFLKRNIESILIQTYKDYEIVISDDSNDDQLKIWLKKYPVAYFKNLGQKGMANNTNNAIEHSQGELIKILFQDDYFYNQHSLGEINKHFTPNCNWLVSSCIHQLNNALVNPHEPYYSDSENTIGSPSVITFRSLIKERFDPEFHWVLDLDLYKRIFQNYGKPKILKSINVVIGLGEHQTTHKLTDIRKAMEFRMLKEKYETN